jgi:nitrogen fixation/metabolism regulation signal transduction histidine kinase
MRSIRTRSDTVILGLPSLAFIYLLLGILGILFSSAFFADTLESGRDAAPYALAIFLSVPIVLLAFLAATAVKLFRDVSRRRAGGKLRARLLGYFLMAALLASVPSTLITTRFVGEILKAWTSTDIAAALEDARWFALDAYRYRLVALERAALSPATNLALLTAKRGDTSAAIAALAAENEGYVALQEFKREKGENWSGRTFVGDQKAALDRPPAFRSGFLPRNDRRDRDVARYVLTTDSNTILVATFSLGTGFDLRVARIELAIAKTAAVSALKPKLGGTLFILYAAFSLPTLLMAVIIAFSLSAAVTQPIVSLADATRRVAEGDFSIRILARPGDDLGALISSFNSMVHDLQSSRAAGLRAEKINVWQDVAQRLAHEIKNPLTPIRLSAERVLRRFKTEPERLAEILEPSMMAIIQEVDGLSTMLTEFRAFARLPPPTLSLVIIYDLVEESVALYRSSYPNVEFHYEAINRDFAISADRRHLAQVLANLILNAIDAMNAAGRIEFMADLVKKRDSRYCRLSIQDNGTGIPERDRPHIFTPYFTTKEKGTGLGLSIVERIVSDLGGTVWFDSAEGVGTTFYIDLPLDRPNSRDEGLSNP